MKKFDLSKLVKPMAITVAVLFVITAAVAGFKILGNISPPPDTPDVTESPDDPTKAPDPTDGDDVDAADFTYSEEDGEAVITGYTGSKTDIVIPAEIDGFKVASIDSCAFEDNTDLVSVRICDGVREIEWSAFEGCSSLKTITIPQSVDTIGDFAFEDCSSLTDIELPDAVTKICMFTFARCSSLKNVTFPWNLKEIQTCAFLDCVSLTRIMLPNGTQTIASDAFEGCDNLQNPPVVPTDPPTSPPTSPPTTPPTSAPVTKRVDFTYFSMDVASGISYETGKDNNGNAYVTFYDTYNSDIGAKKGYTGFGRLGTIHVCPTRETSYNMANNLPRAKWLGGYNGYFLVADYPTDVQWDIGDSTAESKYRSNQQTFEDMINSIN